MNMPSLTIHGRVIDANTLQPIENVHVYAKNSVSLFNNIVMPANGTATNSNGQFTLPSSVAPDDIIVFTHLSYGKEEIKASSIYANNDVWLMEQAIPLDEVVITPTKKTNPMKLLGYGFLAALLIYAVVKKQ